VQTDNPYIISQQLQDEMKNIMATEIDHPSPRYL